ncbi:MAG: asparagine synthase (glutamine-hydrolyzing) [Deltaproteobacteria bacterium]|nr:asparagine synthase (glutamine-hydrolyzing) [Deltaproteobacteria bacterium]
MGEVIRHRGPDAGGEYLDDHIGLAHRRLSIIDLSPQGNQPLFSADGRLAIVFNGEIYNFQILREQLQREGVVFRTKTDTEVILALYSKMGTECLKQFNGMFAFALWDTVEKTLFIARDRIGKKPLYYYHAGGDRLAFASEIKSLLQLPGISREIEPTAISDFLSYQYIPDPKTIYRNIFKLPPAHYMTLQAGGEPHVGEYWDIEFSPRESRPFAAAEEELLALLQDATAVRMISDVPLGAFLSGGVDSSAVVALMAKSSGDPVRTCTIGFQDKRHDESPFAREIAGLFRTNHTEFMVKDRFVDTVSLLPKFFDEPFADSSAVPTYHVSRLARQAVTVALAGDGGDESFAGYDKYAVELKENLVRQYVPRSVLSLIHTAAAGLEGNIMARKARSLSGSALKDPGRAFFRTNSCIEEPQLQQLLADDIRRASSSYDPAVHTLRYWNKVSGKDHVACMLYTDLKTYLPGDILVKVDRMSMANSLEVRAPFLDYRIIEFAASLPSDWKIKGENKKIILKKAFSHLLPDAILNRAKHGFTVPLDDWFRGELKPMAEECLFNQPALAEFLSMATVRRLWQEHQGKRCSHGTILWSLLMLALWQREYHL